jgi:hypothetical protein
MFRWLRKLLRKKRPVEPICGNCKLYNHEKGTCGVAVLYAGREIHIPVDPRDDCFYENEFVPADDDEFADRERLTEHVEQVRWWLEDPETGEQGNKGKVKIEYPDGFFGPEDEPNSDFF